MKIPAIRWQNMWKYVGNTERVVSEDGVNFYPLSLTLECPWHCDDPGCWFRGGPNEHEIGRPV